MKERRQTDRITLNQVIKLGINREEFIDGHLVNIGKGGLLMTTHTLLEPTAGLFIQIAIPPGQDENMVSIDGVITRISKSKKDLYEVAVGFDLPEGDQEKIDNFLAKKK